MGCDTSIIDIVQGYAAEVTSDRELKVSAEVTNQVSTTVSGTVQVNVASQSGQVETTPGESATVAQGQQSVDSTSGGTEIIASASRKGLLITNIDSSITVWIGVGINPTTTTGYPLRPGETFQLPAGVSADHQIKGITDSGSATVAYVNFR